MGQTLQADRRTQGAGGDMRRDRDLVDRRAELPEQPDEEPAKSVMQRFNAVGLPTYVVLKPR